MFDFKMPDGAHLIRLMGADANYVLVDAARIICAEELGNATTRIMIDCGCGSSKEIVITGGVSNIVRAIREIAK